MKTTIRIRGRAYTVRSDEGDVDLQAVAAEVDARMAEVAASARVLDEHTVAILAALNLASDLKRWQHRVERELADVERELASMALVLGAALPVEEDEG